MLKNPLPVQEMEETQVPSLGGEDPLEEGMATYASALAWEIPWTQEPDGPQSMGCKESDTTGHTHTQRHRVLWERCALKVTARARGFTGFETPV